MITAKCFIIEAKETSVPPLLWPLAYLLEYFAFPERFL